MQVAAKKKSIADEAAVILQAKLKQLAPSTQGFHDICGTILSY